MEDKKKAIDIKTIFDFLRITPLVSIGLGFVATSLYFAYIGYFPQNDINSLISVLSYITISSFIVLGIIPFISYFSIFIWVKNTFADPKVSQWLLKPDEIEAAYLICTNQKTDNKHQRKNIILKIIKHYSASVIIPIAIILLTTALFSTAVSLLILLGMFALIIISMFIYPPDYLLGTRAENQEPEKKSTQEINITRTKLQGLIFLLKYLINSLTSSFLLLIAACILILISRSHDLSYEIFTIIAVIALSISWFGHVIESENQLKAHLKSFLLYIAMILIVTQGEIIPSILTHSKLGAFKASIFVNYETCSMFSQLSNEITCTENGLTQIKDVDIKWRGADQYVTFNTKAEDGTIIQHYLIIPSSEIHGEGN